MGVDYLRISITDRCNLRCIYCNPNGRNIEDPHRDILTLEEICRLVSLFARHGIRKVRLTGGEPLLRNNILELIRELAEVPGVDTLALTTNGVLLGPMAKSLKQAGLQQVNISLDSLDSDCYARITGSQLLDLVTDGVQRAAEAGLQPIKINCVVIRDVNLTQVASIAEISIQTPVLVRFIEYHPTSRLAVPESGYVPNSEIRRILEECFGLLSGVVLPGTGGPAVYFRFAGAVGAIGFISGRSSVFCHRCNRLRLTSDGRVRPCLYSARAYDLRVLLRSGATDSTISDRISEILRAKSLYTRLSSPACDFSMQSIGG